MKRRAALLAALIGAVVSGGTATGAPMLSVDRPADEVQTRTPIKHFVTLMQENHSFDNYFGTYPGADGIPAGTCMPRDPVAAPEGACVRPEHVGNRAVQDLGHSDAIFDQQHNGGRMDGFVAAFDDGGTADPAQAMTYYDDRDIPYYWNVADEYVLFDRNFTSARGGSVANHMFWVAGVVGAPEGGEVIPEEGFDAPTVFDRLEQAGVSWKFYVQNYDPTITLRNRGLGDKGSQTVWVPLLNYPRYLDDPRLFSKIVDLSEYYADLERGTLPAVSYIVPSGASEHPPGSIAAGQGFVRTLITSLMRSTSWRSSAFMWTYDDWGGWYDHVAPPVVDRFGYGFRAPALLVSPYARRGHVDSTTIDFTSQIKLISENWGLSSLAARDKAATAPWSAFDFTQPPRDAVLMGTERNPEAPTPPRSSVVYVSYAAALGVFALVVLAAAVAARRARRVVLGGPPLPAATRGFSS